MAANIPKRRSSVASSAASEREGGSEPRPRAIRLIEDRWATLRHAVETLAIVAAGVWAFYTFFYQNEIVPAHDPPALQEIVKIARLGRDRTREFVDCSYGFRNVGRTEIDIAADAWNVWGVRYGTRDRRRDVDDAPMTREPLLEYYDSIPIVSKHLVARLIDLRAAADGGRPAHIVLEPGDETTIHDTIVVRRGAYDVVETMLIAVPVKTSEYSGTGRHVRVAVKTLGDGSVFLDTHTPGVGESDTSTSFALSP